MVDVLGHFATSLLVAAPVWAVLNRRPALAFLGFVVLTAMLPDIDLYLPWVVHHGVTHTLLFVAILAAVGAAVAVLAAPDALARWSPWAGAASVTRGRLYGFAFSGLFLGGFVHVVFDMLSTSATEQVVRPFWPFFEKPFSIYVITSFSEPRWNAVPFVAALALHAVMYRRRTTEG
jgi:membrane-bound metal-dependent hydrolase YbcI (DUF457 family)